MPATKVPYDADGNLQHFPEETYDGQQWVPPDWRPNTPFTAQLTLTCTQRGRSAAYLLWHDEQGHRFPMFLKDMTELVRSGAAIRDGAVRAVWVVQKRGDNYGVRLAGAGDRSEVC